MHQLSIIIRIVVAATLLALTACAPARQPITEESFRASQETMEQISTINKKLIQMAESSRDLDMLEEEGMSRSDVDRMRRAMRQKVRQLTDENIQLIKAL